MGFASAGIRIPNFPMADAHVLDSCVELCVHTPYLPLGWRFAFQGLNAFLQVFYSSDTVFANLGARRVLATFDLLRCKSFSIVGRLRYEEDGKEENLPFFDTDCFAFSQSWSRLLRLQLWLLFAIWWEPWSR